MKTVRSTEPPFVAIDVIAAHWASPFPPSATVVRAHGTCNPEDFADQRAVGQNHGRHSQAQSGGVVPGRRAGDDGLRVAPEGDGLPT